MAYVDRMGQSYLAYYSYGRFIPLEVEIEAPKDFGLIYPRQNDK